MNKFKILSLNFILFGAILFGALFVPSSVVPTEANTISNTQTVSAIDAAYTTAYDSSKNAQLTKTWATRVNAEISKTSIEKIYFVDALPADAAGATKLAADVGTKLDAYVLNDAASTDTRLYFVPEPGAEGHIYAPFDGSQTFAYLTGLQEIDFTNYNTTGTTTFYYYFASCSNLSKINIENFNTSSALSFTRMFAGANRLKSVDVSNFDTSRATSFSHMFYQTGITDLDLTGFNTNNVTTMAGMFSSSSSLLELDLSSFNTSQVQDMYSMFSHTYSLKSVDLSSFNTSSVTNMNGMFYSTGLEKIDVSNFDTSLVTNMTNMFYGTRNLRVLDARNFNLSNVTSMEGFANLKGLQTIYLPSQMGELKFTHNYSKYTWDPPVQYYIKSDANQEVVNHVRGYDGGYEMYATTIDSTYEGEVLHTNLINVLFDFDINQLNVTGTAPELFTEDMILANNSVTFTASENVTIRKNGYIFNGWTIAGDTSGKVYVPGTEYTLENANYYYTFIPSFTTADVQFVGETDGITSAILTNKDGVQQSTVNGKYLITADNLNDLYITTTNTNNAEFVGIQFETQTPGVYQDLVVNATKVSDVNSEYLIKLTDFYNEDFLIKNIFNGVLKIEAVYGATVYSVDVNFDSAIEGQGGVSLGTGGQLVTSGFSQSFAATDSTTEVGTDLKIAPEKFFNIAKAELVYALSTIDLTSSIIDGSINKNIFVFDKTLGALQSINVSFEAIEYSVVVNAVTDLGQSLDEFGLVSNGYGPADTITYDSLLNNITASTSSANYVFSGFKYESGRALSNENTLTNFDFDENEIVGNTLTLVAVFSERFALDIVFVDQTNYTLQYTNQNNIFGTFDFVGNQSLWVKANETVTLVVTPAAGYELDQQSVINNNLTNLNINGNTIIFKVDRAIVLNVEFTEMTYNIKVLNKNSITSADLNSIANNYKLSVAGVEQSTVKFNESLTFELTENQPSASDFVFAGAVVYSANNSESILYASQNANTFVVDSNIINKAVLNSNGGYDIYIYVYYSQQSGIVVTINGGNLANIENGNMGDLADGSVGRVDLEVLENGNYVNVSLLNDGSIKDYSYGTDFRIKIVAINNHYNTSLQGVSGVVDADGYTTFKLLTEGELRIFVDFAAKEYKVDSILKNQSNGILAASVETIKIGDKLTLTFEPTSSYEVFTWDLNGTNMQRSGNSISFDITADFLDKNLIGDTLKLNSSVETIMNRGIFYGIIFGSIGFVGLAILVILLLLRSKKQKAEKAAIQAKLDAVSKKFNIASVISDLREESKAKEDSKTKKK